MSDTVLTFVAACLHDPISNRVHINGAFGILHRSSSRRLPPFSLSSFSLLLPALLMFFPDVLILCLRCADPLFSLGLVIPMPYACALPLTSIDHNAYTSFYPSLPFLSCSSVHKVQPTIPLFVVQLLPLLLL